MSRAAFVVLVLAIPACSGRFIYDDVDVAEDTAPDVGDAKADVVYDAQFYPSTPPPPGTYSPHGGICPYALCGPNSICDEVSGWCCGGRWVRGACKCGSEDGCAPPSVCCWTTGSVGKCAASVAACPGAH